MPGAGTYYIVLGRMGYPFSIYEEHLICMTTDAASIAYQKTPFGCAETPKVSALFHHPNVPTS